MSLYYSVAKPPTPSTPTNVLAVLIHGGALSGRMYRTLTPLLDFPSIAVDLPGHGKSVDLGPFTFSKSTESLFTLIQNLHQSEEYKDHKIILVGISLGGQAVLDYVLHHPSTISAAVVSGASINPPDDKASWEMPHMPTDQEWLDIMTEDVQIMGMDNAANLQKESLAFGFEPEHGREYPPLLICIGEHDVAMAKRDYIELVEKAKRANDKSSGKVLDNMWHNHSIDMPEEFAAFLSGWVQEMFAQKGDA